MNEKQKKNAIDKHELNEFLLQLQKDLMMKEEKLGLLEKDEKINQKKLI